MPLSTKYLFFVESQVMAGATIKVTADNCLLQTPELHPMCLIDEEALEHCKRNLVMMDTSHNGSVTWRCIF